MTFTPKDFSHLLGMEGFSEKLLTNHFTLYEGYVKNASELATRLAELCNGDATTAEYAELRRRFGWEWNGMRLHELYFGNLTKESSNLPKTERLISLISKQFGSFNLWEKEFRMTGAMRGIGWVILAFDEATENLHNVWINEHDLGYLAGTKPLLVMDVFEHAFILDYGLKRGEYIDAFFRHIDWKAVETRLG